MRDQIRAAIRCADEDAKFGYELGPGSDSWMEKFLAELEKRGLKIVTRDSVLQVGPTPTPLPPADAEDRSVRGRTV